MARKARGETPRGCRFFHLLVEGVGGVSIFGEHKFKAYYMRELVSRGGGEVKLLAFIILENHAHLLFFSPDVDSLTLIMKRVNTSFALYYNKCKFRSGYVFNGRFKCQCVAADDLADCMEYVHSDCVRESAQFTPKAYPYSSYKQYQTLRPDVEGLLKALGYEKNEENAIGSTDNAINGSGGNAIGGSGNNSMGGSTGNAINGSGGNAIGGSDNNKGGGHTDNKHIGGVDGGGNNTTKLFDGKMGGSDIAGQKDISKDYGGKSGSRVDGETTGSGRVKPVWLDVKRIAPRTYENFNTVLTELATRYRLNEPKELLDDRELLGRFAAELKRRTGATNNLIANELSLNRETLRKAVAMQNKPE